MHKTMAIAAAAVSLVAQAELRELSFMTAMPVAEKVAVDGKLDESAWKTAVPNCNYFRYLDEKGTHVTNLQTRCLIVFDDRGLYTGVINYDANIKLIRRNHIKDNNAAMWYDDCAELYFDPAANGVGYYKFTVNPNGTKDSCWRMDAANVHEEWRHPGVVAAAQVFDDRWELELFVPWEAFGLKGRPDAGTFWTFNHSRFKWKPWNFCSSAPCACGTQPQRFGLLYFSDGSAPTPDGILATLRERQQPDWGIQIGDTTYLHTLEGTRKIGCPLSELIVKKENEAKAFAAQCRTNVVGLLKGTATVPPLKLDLAGTYDFNPPKDYDGYSGWYRHNADPKVVGAHLEWAKKTADRPRVLFLTTLNGQMRDALELAARFEMDADVMPVCFSLTGIWEDCVKGGTPLDKCRQFESLLARNPDVICIAGGMWDGIPAKYQQEILRRVRDEGLGLAFTDWRMRDLDGRPLELERDPELRRDLAAATPCAEFNSVDHGAIRDGLTPSERGIRCFWLGKGKILCAGVFGLNWDISRPEWVLRWAADFETRYATLFNLIRGVQARERKVSFAFQDRWHDRVTSDGSLNFLAFRVKVDGSMRAAKAELRLRLRDEWNNVVRDEVRGLDEGDNVLAYDICGLAGGAYVLDLVASVGGAVDSVAFRPFTVVSPLGAVTVSTNQTNVVMRQMGVSAQFERPAPSPAVAVWTLKTLPYGDTVCVQTNRIARRDRQVSGPQLGRTRFPTKAGALEVVVSTTNGVKIADAKRVYFFPDWDFDPYTLIMWDNLAAGGNLMMPLLAKPTVGEFGYDSHLGESGFQSALFDSRAVPYIAHVSLQLADNGGVTWPTWGSTFGWGGEPAKCKSQFDGGKNKETNPYDPRVQAALERFLAPKIRKTAPYGVCVWSLGDENGFDYEAGNGPQDKAPFAKFLEEKYGTVGKFNAVHGTNVADFASAPHLIRSKAIKARDWPAYYDHVQYMDRMYSDFFQMMSGLIKRYDPKARVGAEGSSAGELEQTVEKLEFWGPYRSLITDELLRNLDPNKVRGTWWGGYFDNLRDGFPVQQWEYLLTGTLNADQWFSLHPGSSQGAFGGDFKFAPYVAKMMPYLKTIRRGMAQSFQATPFRDDGFAIFYSYASGHASTLDDAFPPPGDAMSALITFCYRKGYGVKMVTGRTIRKLADAKVLFLCGASSLSDAEAAVIKEWTAKGGLLVSDCEPGVLDGFLAKRVEAPLKGLWTPYRWDSSDAELAAILAKKGIVNKESIEGIPAASCVFRVRELDGMRLVGFKCVKKDLGRKVTIDLGEAGTVYEFDSGKCLGQLAKIEIASLDVPFKCYAVFKSAPSAPDPKALVPGRVYRLTAHDADGNEIAHRTKVFTAKKGVDPMRDFFIPVGEPVGTTYRIRDVNSGLASEIGR